MNRYSIPQYPGMDFRKFPKAIGIYKITNIVNGKLYIGLTINLRSRCKLHRQILRKGNHDNEHLQNAWNLYGEWSFEFEVLEICLKENLSNREDYWCKLLKTHNRDFGYNILGTGDFYHHPESIVKMKKCSRERINRIKEAISKKVININTGTIYNSIKEAGATINMLEQTLGKMLSGKRANYTCFRYYEKDKSINDYDKVYENRKWKKVIDTKTGKVYKSVKELSDVLNIPHSTICRKLNGLRNNDTDYRYL